MKNFLLKRDNTPSKSLFIAFWRAKWQSAVHHQQRICQYWKSMHVMYTIDFQYWQWISERSLCQILCWWWTADCHFACQNAINNDFEAENILENLKKREYYPFSVKNFSEYRNAAKVVFNHNNW